MTIYEFPEVGEETGYHVFEECLETDPHVFFHGTAALNLEDILRDGFKPKPPLCTASFSTSSPVALRYACDARKGELADGCIVVVRYPDLKAKGLDLSGSVLHDALIGGGPKIVGYCIVPAAYRHI